MRNQKRAFTILEVIVTCAVFSIAMVVLAYALTASKTLLADTSGSSAASQSMRKVYLELEEDLRSSAFAKTAVGQSMAAPGTGVSGDVLWFLSSEDPVTGAKVWGKNGEPLWQRNILYYTAVPTNHSTLYGFNCTGGSNTDGYDVHCPHKVLIRKVIDSGPTTVPTDESTQETILAAGDIASYLTVPTGFKVPITNPGVDEAKVIAPALLTFRAQRAPDAVNYPDELRLKLQATALEDLGKSTALGTADLEQARQTETMEFSIFPVNK